MHRSDLTISLITDEVSASLDEGLAFARAEDVRSIDLRVIDGRNVLSLARDELAHAARRVRAAGLTVSCLCTPLLKWSPAGKASLRKGDQFGFELGDRAPSTLFAHAFEAAEILGARNLRIFSYLAYAGYQVDDLFGPLGDLIVLAEKFDMRLHVENEGVCNITDFAELETLMLAYQHPRLRALPDIANAQRSSVPPSVADLGRLLPFTDIIHCKDYSSAAGHFVAIGEGDTPLAPLLAATLPAHRQALTLAIETHAPADPAATTRRSLQGLRRMIDGLGLP